MNCNDCDNQLKIIFYLKNTFINFLSSQGRVEIYSNDTKTSYRTILKIINITESDQLKYMCNIEDKIPIEYDVTAAGIYYS